MHSVKIRVIFLVSLIGFIPFSFLGLFLVNPNGSIGGYISLLGKIMILPILLYREVAGYFTGIGDWILCMVGQFFYFFIIALLIRFIFIKLKIFKL